MRYSNLPLLRIIVIIILITPSPRHPVLPAHLLPTPLLASLLPALPTRDCVNKTCSKHAKHHTMPIMPTMSTMSTTPNPSKCLVGSWPASVLFTVRWSLSDWMAKVNVP